MDNIAFLVIYGLKSIESCSWNPVGDNTKRNRLFFFVVKNDSRNNQVRMNKIINFIFMVWLYLTFTEKLTKTSFPTEIQTNIFNEDFGSANSGPFS